MNDQRNKLQQSLERATAAECIPENELDGETAALREAWTALGQLLEAAQPSGEPLAAPWTVPLPARPRYVRRAVAGVLAASLLLGVVAAWMWSLTRSADRTGATPVQVASTISRDTSPTPSQRQTTAADLPQWDDALDEQIAQVGQHVLRLQQDSHWHASDLSVVQYGVEQVKQDINGDTL